MWQGTMRKKEKKVEKDLGKKPEARQQLASCFSVNRIPAATAELDRFQDDLILPSDIHFIPITPVYLFIAL